ncbi:MAG TPA: SRPBCC family protein [Gemmataceae bacterium]|nr:SRPBCC family protein [Gemmataceae bacterium]
MASKSDSRTGDPFSLTLPSDREIRIRRVLEAPRRLVFEAMTRPEHIRRFWGPRIMTMTKCEVDFRVGGSWRFVLTAPDGSQHPFTGVYKEIVPPERIVQTFIYDVDMIRDHPAVETLTLEERGNQTIVTVTVLHDSKESRDGHVNAGMEGGARETYDRLAELLTELSAAPASAV